MLICPVCGQALQISQPQARCPKGHSFDKAKEGYVNLLCTHKSGERMGDDKQSARCRRDFLNKGYYAPLKDGLTALFSDKTGKVLDICCGEGYYTSALAENENLSVYGFDLSKEMVRLGAKRGRATYFVANMAAIPVAPESFDYATHLFAPFLEEEFAKILKPGGTLYTVVPGEKHLFGLKQALYETPYLNDEALPQTKILEFLGREKITAQIRLESPEDIEAVFRMTPYYFHTSPQDKAKLLDLNTLETPIEFVIGAYQKP